MCGIGGWIGERDDQALTRMQAALRHRGPDDAGQYVSDHASLFHQRLSIIDLKAGHQPMGNETGRYQIVFNGEIYNYLDLRKQLIAKGHQFRTHSDTETIIHLYEELGERCVEKLVGMFALAIWDSQERTLFLARDRLGIKPLFYAQAGGRFLFASELKGILASGLVARQLDPHGIDHYMTFMYVPAPGTIVNGVRKLLPGHTITAGGHGTSLRRYWQLPSPGDVLAGGELRGVPETLQSKLHEAVRCRLMSEVPLGAYLSGGLDSSLIVGLMARSSEQPVNTFSVGFQESGFDERPHAKCVADKFDTHHRELVVKHHALDDLTTIIHALDEPVADSAAIPTYLMAELTKPYATVILTGEGADELFAGYSHYKILTWIDRLRALSPGAAIRAIGRLFPFDNVRRATEIISNLRNRVQVYLALKSVFTPTEKRSLYTPSLWSACRQAEQPEALLRQHLGNSPASWLQQLLRFELATWLPDDLLVKVDRTTMAHAVEARVPYLDHRVVEYAMRIPDHLKLYRGSGKRVLRDVAQTMLPHSIVRRRKQGFSVPIATWATAQKRDLVQDLLGEASTRQRSLFDPKYLATLCNCTTYSMFQRRQMWSILCLELWSRIFIDESPTT